MRKIKDGFFYADTNLISAHN